MGMVYNTLYNLTDFWFAGVLSDDALAGVSVAGSVFFVLLAVGMGIQTGASAVVAADVGAGDDESAGVWANHVFGLALVLSAVVTVTGLLVAEPLVIFLGAEKHIAPLSLEYLFITLTGTFTFILGFAAAGVLMALGNTRANRNALAAGFFVNLALNPLLTFVLDLGVAGLALATVIIKALSAAYLYYILLSEYQIRCRPAFALKAWLILLRQVIPASINMLTIIIGGFITVSLLGRFGTSHVAGYAVGLRIEQLLLLPALGLNAAVMAISGQNFGSGNMERVRETYIVGLKVGLAMALLSIPVMVLLSPLLVGMFSDDRTIIETGASYLRIDAVAFYSYVVLFLSTAVLQGIKQPVFPMVLGVCRQLVLPVSINVFLIVYLDYPMLSVFYTIVIVVTLSSVVAHWYTLRQIRKESEHQSMQHMP